MIAIHFIGKSNKRKFSSLQEFVEFDYDLNSVSIDFWKRNSLDLLREEKVLDLLDTFFIEDTQEWHVVMYTKNLQDADYVCHFITNSRYFKLGVENLKKHGVHYYCEIKNQLERTPSLIVSEVCTW